MFTNDCQLRWVWRYLENKRIPPSGAMKLGLGVHETASHNFDQKAESRKDLPVSEQTDFFAQNWEQGLQAEEVVFDADQTPGKMKDQGIDMIKAHHAGIAPKVQPESKAAVEQKIWQLIIIEKLAELDDRGDQKMKNLLYTLQGPDWRDAGQQAQAKVAELEEAGRELVLAYQLDSIIDVTDEQGIVRELKTRASSAQQLDADKLVDLTQYSLARRMATKKVEKGLSLDVVVKTKQASTQMIPTKRSREQIEFHLNRIGNMARTIENRSFVPHTDWYGCSPKFCGYWSICAGRGLVTIDVGGNLQSQLKESVDREEGKAKEERREEIKAEVQEGKGEGKGGAAAPERPSSNGGDAVSDDGRQRLLRIARGGGRRVPKAPPRDA